MNKRITSLLLCFVMVFSLLFTALPVFAVPGKTTTLTARPDKATASPGETITYTVTLGAVEDLLGIKFKLIIPEGLTFVTGAEKAGVKEALGATSAEFTPSTKVFLADPEYTGTSDLDLMTFECTVDSGASGNLTVQLYIDDPDNYYDSDGDNIDVQVTNATITVTAAPKPATGISLNKSTLELTVGESETLVATVEPADTTDTVTWDTGRSEIATVDSTGKVTAVGPGTTIIAARAGEKSAFCTVTVVAAPCTHTNKSTVPSQDSTCTEKGWDEHKKCDDCGQLFDTSDVEIDEVPFLNLADHTGGTATCTTKAVCSVCHQPYGNYANHSYTAETKKQEALKTAGNCRDKAVYYYSCSECGNVEHNDAHTFEGDKDANTHVGGTSTVNASEPDHKNQVDGYTGDTKCLGCGEIIATGTSIPAGAHTPSSTWNSDGTYHWKECTTVGCGVVIDGSKAKHSSTGANVATCQHKAVCDVCNVEYGELAAHNPASGWTSDASGHWHACQTAGCTEKCDFATHTPDHQGHATEEYAIKCTECGYVIEAQLGHTHDVDTTKYESDETNHWNTCSGCGEKQNVSAHELEWKIDKEATATEKGSKHEECKVCGYKKAAVEIPATGTPTDPTPENPDSPPTGDNSMMTLWIAVLFVSGFGVVTTAVYGKKRHSVK